MSAKRPTFAITYVERVDAHTVVTRIWQGGFRLKREAWRSMNEDQWGIPGSLLIVMRQADAERLVRKGYRKVSALTS